MYALLDWDGTLMSGYTINYWMDFLIEHNVIDPENRQILNAEFDRYRRGEIDHDTLAMTANNVLAYALKGKAISEIEQQAQQFMPTLRKYIHGFTLPLLYGLNQRGIRPIIVSGASTEPISAWLNGFLVMIHAVELRKTMQTFTGKVQVNPGVSTYKRQIADRVRNDVILGMGDSSSDLPLLEHAKVAIVVGDKHIQDAAIHIMPISSAETILEWVDSYLEKTK